MGYIHFVFYELSKVPLHDWIDIVPSGSKEVDGIVSCCRHYLGCFLDLEGRFIGKDRVLDD